MRFSIIVFSFLVLMVPSVVAQPVPSANDSLPLRMLSPVVIEALSLEGDRLQRFYRTTQSATTEDILCHLPSVYLIRRGSYGQEPVIRGQSAGQISVMVDGMRMFGACTDKMDPVTIYIEPQNLQTLHITPGVAGSVFGSTTGGSINLSLARPDFSLGYIIQSGATYYSASRGFSLYGITNLSKPGQAVRASVVYRNHQPYRSGGGQRIAFTQYEKFNTLLSSSWLTGRDTLSADLLVDYGWNIGFPALPMDVGYASAGLGSVTYSRGRPGNFISSLKAKVYYNRIYHTMDDSHRPDVVMHMNMPGRSVTAGSYVEGKLKSLARHRISFRADTYFNKALAEMTMYPENESPMYMQTWPQSWRWVTGFFLKNDYQLNNNSVLSFQYRSDLVYTHINEGLGLDQLKVFYPNVQPGKWHVPVTADVSYAQYLTAQLRLVAQGGFGQRLPSLSEYAGFYLFNRLDGHDYVGNPELKMENSIQGSLALDYLGDRSEIEARTFIQRFSDYILGVTENDLIPMTPGASGVRIYQNYSGALFAGLEAKWMWNKDKDFMLLSQVKYVRARLHNGEAVPLIPPLNGLISARIRHHLAHVQLDVEGNAAQPYYHESFGEDRTPAYAIVNLRIEKTWKVNQLNLLLQSGVENLFDRNYYTHLDWGNIPRPGRNIYLTVQLTWR